MRAIFKSAGALTPSRRKVSDNIEYRRLINAQEPAMPDDGFGRLKLLREASVRNPRSVALVPIRSLSLAPFSFPFAGASKVREALKLQVLPYAAAGDMELFPVTLHKKGRGAEGIVWYVSSPELVSQDFSTDATASVPQTQTAASVPSLVWPAPLPLVSSVGGTGVTLWSDEKNLCSVLWQDYRPLIYRWRPAAKSSPDDEFEWFDRYCIDRELDRGESMVFYADNPSAGDVLGDIAAESVTRCPWMLSVNLSRTALQGAMDLERSVGMMTKAACWLLFMGAVVLGGSVLRLWQEQRATEAVRAKSEALYREVFEPSRTGRISNPVTLARDMMAGLQGGNSGGRGLDGVLTELGAVFTENPSMDVKLDILRYNADGIDCTGSAPDMSTVLAFRKAWETRSSLSQLDNTQSVSGLGYRFDLRVRW